MTATLPRNHVETDERSAARRSVVVARWHELRRIGGLIALGLSLVAGIILVWPAMAIIAVLGAAVALDATIALRTERSDVAATLVADITFTGFGLVIAAVPPAAIGMVVAYYVLVLAVLGTSSNAWPIGLYAVVVGVVASVAPTALGLDGGPVERSLVAGVIVVAVFGISTISITREFARMRRKGKETTGRRIEVADAITKASTAFVAEDESRALGLALEAIRVGMDVSAVFVERNVHDPQLGMCAVVVDRASDDTFPHPSIDRQSKVPWSSMPGARAHLEGGAPFFYRVEESRGTAADRGGDRALQVEVNVPIVVAGEWVGVVGAADCDDRRIWRSDDLMLLRTLGDLTAAFWQRERDAKMRDSLIGSLDGRLRYEEAIASASQALLGERAGGLHPALRAVGIAAGVDEVFVTATHADVQGNPTAEVVATWVAPGSTETVENSDAWSYEGLDDVREALVRGDLAEWDTESVLSLVASVEVEGAWSGSVAFRHHGPERIWDDRERAFLRTIADMLGAFYERARNRARLEESLSSKDQLIASVSHELRTPLTAVVGLADELRSAGDSFDVIEREQLLGVIADESSEMADLVEDLLVAARSQDGSIPVFPERIDLALLTQSVISHLAVPESVTVRIDDVDSVAYADPVRVRQIVRNLLTNAFRYGGPTITATYGSDGTSAWVDIHDDGVGIPEAERKAIFEPYGRSRSSTTVKASVGLGLTLSRRLAELMDGSLDYVDGDGTTFRLSVPLPTPEDR